MLNPPRTIQQAMKRRYGFSHIDEAYNVSQCAYAVIDPHFGERQCFRKRGHGPAGLYCSQHGRILLEQDRAAGSKEHLDWLSAFCGI